jgi:hypothetical protein
MSEQPEIEPRSEKRPIAWGMWLIVALVVGMGAMMAIRPDKIVSDRLPPGLMTPGQLIVAVYAEVDGVRREYRGPDVRLPVGSKFRMRVLLSDNRKLSLGALSPDRSFKSGLLSSSLPPGIHTVRKTIEITAESDFTVMAGPPIAFADARMGMEVEGIERIRVRALLPEGEAAPGSTPPAATPPAAP